MYHIPQQIPLEFSIGSSGFVSVGGFSAELEDIIKPPAASAARIASACSRAFLSSLALCGPWLAEMSSWDLARLDAK